MSDITFTSKIGKFIFAEGTPLSLAKLVRDTVTAQWLNPRPSELELKEVEDAYRYIGTHPSAQINRIRFDIELYPQYDLESLAQLARDAGYLEEKIKDAYFSRALNSIKKAILNYGIVDTASRNQHAYL